MENDDEGIFHYEHVSQVPKSIEKYWWQRHDIFSKYDEGVWMTDDAWFGVTPEPVAMKVAEHIAAAAPPSKKYIIDAFAGAGGNAMAFARTGRWDRVFAVELDPHVLKCAKNNAAVYGVDDKITWRHGDCFDVIEKCFQKILPEAVIFASPPWGGPSYMADDIFDLSTMEPYSLSDIYNPFAKVARDIALYLPRTSNLNQLATHVTKDTKVQVTHYCMKGASKALVVYYGDFTFDAAGPT
ncbi:RNA methylase family protein [Pseudovirgaria hyperparasitica]|uniref:Trimethylguanosine synthase n=1 Tax=Pseudovirgaria hyperparasitica TaxID=470096 RepID=A0A6A6WCY4_9PEZI|nr:RNA methylase family protein [Pseudovirgaria hyperparasitica]KAF2760692.1 RNA methylase family protein [Pseudovirgaria hyperparasitica]